MNSLFMKKGYFIKKNFINFKDCEKILSLISAFRTAYPLTKIFRPFRPLPLEYSVIDGNSIKEKFDLIQKMYTGEINEMLNQLSGLTLKPLRNTKVGVNINIMPAKASSYRWHYDRNLVTAILYLNQVEGGETIFYPNYRLPLKTWPRLQRIFDYCLQLSFIRKFAKKLFIRPEPGKLVIMKANQCLHCVLPVKGQKDRIAIIFSYDLPNAKHKVEKDLDAYLYTKEKLNKQDPNY